MGESTRGFPPLAEPTKRSEVVSMVARSGYPLAVLALLKKGLGNVFPTSGKCTPTRLRVGLHFPLLAKV